MAEKAGFFIFSLLCLLDGPARGVLPENRDVDDHILP
jgi:hypothetical protein